MTMLPIVTTDPPETNAWLLKRYEEALGACARPLEDKALDENGVSRLHPNDEYRDTRDYRALRRFIVFAEIDDMVAIEAVRMKRKLAVRVEVGRAAKRRRARIRVVK